MSKDKEIAGLFNEKLNELASARLAELVKERIMEQDPTIDWTKIRTIADLKTQDFHFETDDSETEDKLQSAINKLKENSTEG
ncbi:hypothetical protein WBJ53_14835 [Spirosoma sp. SC4-14]|uniref:hypothetical protein n=1 Tax=Spirosoma sp. SC4-14 TaxID=3128900 RepID=UPI0030CFABD4